MVLDQAFFEHKRRWKVADSIRERIELLVLETPSEFLENEWATAVLYTSLLHSNSMLPSQCDLRQLQEFEQDLIAKTQNNVDMRTIEWIWYRYAHLCPAGNRYRKGFRKQMIEDIRLVRELGGVYKSATSFRRDVQQRYRQD